MIHNPQKCPHPFPSYGGHYSLPLNPLYSMLQYNMPETDETHYLGDIIHNQRIRLMLSLKQVAEKSDVSISHLNRIENAQRYPSTKILRKIARSLEFDEKELFSLAGYLPEEAPPEVQVPDKYELLVEIDLLSQRFAENFAKLREIIKRLPTK